jgi:hypothetical protein
LLKSPIYIKLKTLNDFARLVCSLERIPSPVYEYNYQGTDILAVPFDSLSGRSIIYYIDNTQINENQYLLYKISNNMEEAYLVDKVRDTSALYSPIIKVSSLPQPFIRPSKISAATRYTGVGLHDLLSLSKLVAFRTIYEESTIPLFLFPKNVSNKSSIEQGQNIPRQILGTPMSMLDSADTSYFYYVSINEIIDKCFLKFSIQKSHHPTFSNHIDEHGFIYLKVIQLDAPHPLVKI